MAQFTTPLLLFSLIIAMAATTSYSAVSKPSPSSTFVKSSCRVTRFPELCVESLASFSNIIQESPKQMAQTALLFSLARARSSKTYVTKVSRLNGLKKREYRAVRDCVDEMGDSVDRLTKSISELGNLGGNSESFFSHMSNVQTWVSAALTDENTCMDGFAGHALDGRLKAAIRTKITNVAQHTSNALALINHFADKH